MDGPKPAFNGGQPMNRIKQSTRIVMIFMIALGLTGLVIPGNADAAWGAKDKFLPGSFTELAQAARPGVVNIRTVKTIKGGGRVYRHFFGQPFGKKDPFRDFFGPFMEEGPEREYKQRSLGSGFIIDAEGYIVTNNHVIENADQIKVKLANEKEFDAELVGRDPKTDLALIKIAASQDLTPLSMGNSDDLAVGSWVVAIGSPFGLEQTVTAGIVSAKGRIIGSGPYDDFIQTDASINPGNSGGPLLNMQGEVVGINTAIVASGQGIGFAIPVNLAAGIIDQLKSSGEVTRGWLGVGIQDLTPELADYYRLENKKGVLVTHVYEDDPADKAGIKPNDVITAVGGQSVATTRDLSSAIADSRIGEKTAITILRNGTEKTVYVKLKKRDDATLAAKGTPKSTDELGIKLSELSSEMAERLGYDPDERGVLVTQVTSASKADKAGIQQGDLIKEINHETITTLESYQKQMRKIKAGSPVSLLIKRPKAGFVAVTLTR